jgi:cell division protein FtsQ
MMSPTFSRPRRKRPVSPFLAMGDSWRVRAAARTGAVAFLGLAILRGILLGGYLDYEGSPWMKLPGKMAGLAGMAAEDIKITGLVHQEPEAILTAIGIAPGGSLIGFDAGHARRLLESLDWVAAAKVQRLFPNQLEIAVTERQPFAIWQRGGAYYVIDRDGAAMSNISASQMTNLPLVTGEGAQTTAAELINQLEAFPALMLQVKAAARVGDRRWNLYLDSGVKVLLPEDGVDEALAQVARLDETQKLLSKGISSVDLRLGDRVTVAMAAIDEKAAEAGKKKPAKSR